MQNHFTQKGSCEKAAKPEPSPEYQIHLLSDDGFTSLYNRSIRILD
jgi:hypothetical protein